MKHKKLRLSSGFRVAIGNSRSQAAEMIINSGEGEGGPDNSHRGADQWLFVISGKGSAVVNRRKYALQPGTLILIEAKDKHEIKNTGRELLRTLNIYVPPAYTPSGSELPPGKSEK